MGGTTLASTQGLPAVGRRIEKARVREQSSSGTPCHLLQRRTEAQVAKYSTPSS